MGLKIIDILAALALNLIRCAHTDHILSCNASVWGTCSGQNQICNQTSSKCECIESFTLVGDTCEAPENYGAHSTTTIVVIIFALALIICGLVLVIKKYSLLDYVRQKLRRNTDILYEDVMIGNDDPPLSP